MAALACISRYSDWYGRNSKEFEHRGENNKVRTAFMAPPLRADFVQKMAPESFHCSWKPMEQVAPMPYRIALFDARFVVRPRDNKVG